MHLDVISPVLILGAGAVLVLLVALVAGEVGALLRTVGLLVVAAAALASLAAHGTGFSGVVVAGPLSRVADFVVLAGAAAAMTLPAPGRWGERWSAYLALTLWAAAGMALTAASDNLIVLFLGVEVLSLGLYVLTAFAVEDGRGAEAAFKYFILGGLGSGLLLMGAAFAFAGRGSLALSAQPGWTGLPAGIGLALIVGGLAFKLALAPFQLWTPDVYEGAPTGVTAFMAVGTKAAAFIALARVMLAAAPAAQGLVAVLGAVSMFVGYLLAMRQPGIKRLLAFSGIANAGTLVLALLAPAEFRAIAFAYLAAYAAATLGAFAVVAVVEARGPRADLDALRGLSGRAPWLAAALIICLLSLASVPLTGGFLAKLLLLEGLAHAGHPFLAVLVVLATVVGLYPYFRVILAVLAPADGAAVPDALSVAPRLPAPRLVAALAVLATFAIGILPGPLLHG